VEEQKESKKTLLVAYVNDASFDGVNRVNAFMDHDGTDIVIQINTTFTIIWLFIKDDEVYKALNDQLEKRYIFARMQRNDKGWVVLNIYEGQYRVNEISQKLLSCFMDAGFNTLVSDNWVRVMKPVQVLIP